MIQKNILNAFGFRKCKRGESYCALFSEASYYNPFLDIYYDPQIHSDKQFASNIVSGITFRYRSTLEVSALEGANNFNQKVIGEK